jgi:ornithine--oxo-acid transaminase
MAVGRFRVPTSLYAGITKVAGLHGQPFRQHSHESVSANTKEVVDKELRFGAHNYHPIPVALTKGKGKILVRSLIL